MSNNGASIEHCDVAVVGGGPSGLALATELRRCGVGRVILLERDREAGGVPRHCGHHAWGFREFHRLLDGPAYAHRHIANAEKAGVDIRTGNTVTALWKGGRLGLSTNDGVSELRALRVALCTGAREASRAQRFIGGARPQGVMTTGALQAFVHLERLTPFRRPVIVGTELVSFSALLTCRHAGIRPAAMIEEGQRITARSFARALPTLLGVPVLIRARIRRILGQRRVEGVEIADADGETRVIDADGVICTGLFRPESALLRSGHLAVHPATGGPVVDQYGHTNDPAYVCAGNILRPIETHAWCAMEGRRAAQTIVEDLTTNGRTAAADVTTIEPTHEAIRYVLPQFLSARDGAGAAEHLQIRLTRAARGRLIARVNDDEVWSMPIDSRPERRILAPLSALLPHRGAAPIELSLEEA